MMKRDRCRSSSRKGFENMMNNVDSAVTETLRIRCMLHTGTGEGRTWARLMGGIQK